MQFKGWSVARKNVALVMLLLALLVMLVKRMQMVWVFLLLLKTQHLAPPPRRSCFLPQ
jgi:hypothetical protein